MAKESIKNKTTIGVFWSSVERFSVQAVQFIVMLVLARLLSPDDFGLVGMLTIFIAVSDSLVNSGFSQALIRKQDRTDDDNSTIFYFNVIVSVIIYFLLFISAPYVAQFYNEPQLTILMRVLCLVVVFHSFGVVQRALYTAAINFKVQAKATFIAAIVSGIVGISLAWARYGVWALIWQQLVNAFFCTFLFWFFSSWRPKWIYSWQSFKDMFGFGSRLMISGLIDTIYNNLYQMVIGKVFSASALGNFSQAKHFPNLPATSITNIVQRVTYPSLCKLQDNNIKLSEAYRQLLRLSAFIIFPIMCLLAGLADPLVNILIGSKWHYASTLIPPLCFSMMLYPIHAINLNLLQVKGRSDWILKLEILKKIVGVVVLIATIPFGLTIMCWARIISSIISLFLNTHYTGIIINLNIFVQIKDISATFVASFLAFIISSCVSYFVEGDLLQLVIGLILGILVYCGIAYTCKFKELKYLRSILPILKK